MSQFEESSLSKEDEEFIKNLEDGRGVFTQMGSLFRGPMAIMSVVVFIFILIFAVLMIYCGYKAITSDDLRMTILWCTGGLASLLPHGLMRIWVFNRMNHLSVLRELRKIELRLARVEQR